MDLTNQYLVFTIDEQRYALGLSGVEKVIRAVQLDPLPEGQEMLLGVINMQGQIIPVLDIRKKFYLPHSEMDISDRIVISRTSKTTFAFIVDTVQGVVEIPKEEVREAQKIFPNLEQYIDGVGKLHDDTVLIYNVDNLLSVQDVKDMSQMLKDQD